ncbi:hypothetical protein ABZ756_15205 [Mammaliicoccus sciuri]|uniref:Uncharacterized protein n=1 Tax=Sporosarcina newyorkensis TaxID=759851 RepID=A0A1T4YP11_9BACL|nr:MULTISPECIES: hypothetical protein [Sporosarcina]MBY0222261.1 hypothetical protein [Sporosarcina aquimarina]SKB03519.1 hypothetical protein SAMN04244570_3205 [Sporosarcina newyorkensis]
MLKKIILLLTLCFLLILYLPQLIKPSPALTTAFRLTENPTVIVRGSQGSALTINISFGEQEVKDLLEQLTQPYPLLFVDVEWASRFPNLVEEMKKRSLPVALLGQEGNRYEVDRELFEQQLDQFETFFETRPLWFRTVDEQFPQPLLHKLNEAEINALGSTVHWKEGALPKAAAGDIISIPHHLDERAQVEDIERLMASRPFQSVEDLLFQPKIKTKKIPK